MTEFRIDICPDPYEEGYVLQFAEFTMLLQHTPDTPVISDVSTGITAHREEQILQHVDVCRRKKQFSPQIALGSLHPDSYRRRTTESLSSSTAR
jgi:hypothetical protein